VAGRPVAFLGDAVALVGDAVAVIGHALTLVNGSLALVGNGPGLVKRRPALGQVGLGGLEGLLGGLGAGLGLSDPDVVQGQGGQPLTLGALDDLAGQLGQLPGRGPGAGSELLERRLGVGALGGGQDPLACSIQTRRVRACCSWASSSLWLASSTAVWTSSPATAANSPIASSSWVVQARGWVL
jgi:hypothetical protein